MASILSSRMVYSPRKVRPHTQCSPCSQLMQDIVYRRNNPSRHNHLFHWVCCGMYVYHARLNPAKCLEGRLSIAHSRKDQEHERILRCRGWPQGISWNYCPRLSEFVHVGRSVHLLLGELPPSYITSYLSGPNIATGHTSVIFFEECQVRSL